MSPDQSQAVMSDHFYVCYPAMTRYSLCVLELRPWDYLFNMYHSSILIFPELFIISIWENFTFSPLLDVKMVPASRQGVVQCRTVFPLLGANRGLLCSLWGTRL